jgi:hypothetical protein
VLGAVLSEAPGDVLGSVFGKVLGDSLGVSLPLLRLVALTNQFSTGRLFFLVATSTTANAARRRVLTIIIICFINVNDNGGCVFYRIPTASLRKNQ